jgi:hypothetical protein
MPMVATEDQNKISTCWRWGMKHSVRQPHVMEGDEEGTSFATKGESFPFSDTMVQ